MVTTVLSFKTREQKTIAKKNGRIEGHFGKIDKGRPMKPKVNQILIGGNAPMNETKQAVIQAGKKGGKGSCANWNLPENFHALKSSRASEPKATRTMMRTQGLFHLQQQQFPGQHFNESPSDGLLLLNKRTFSSNK